MHRLEKTPKTSQADSQSEPTAAPIDPALDEANAKIAELTADLQRTRADFENYRKNVEKDKEN